MTQADTTPENPNIHYRDSLTVWGETCSVQVRDLATVAINHYEDAPRSTEDSEPYLLPTLDAVLLRDLLNAATDRRFLPQPAQGALVEIRTAYEEYEAGLKNREHGLVLAHRFIAAVARVLNKEQTR